MSTPAPSVLAEALFGAGRKVRTAAGAKYYGQPIGSVIIADSPLRKAQRIKAKLPGTATFIGRAIGQDRDGKVRVRNEVTGDVVAVDVDTIKPVPIKRHREGWTPVEAYGLNYDKSNAQNPAVVGGRALSPAIWNRVPVTDWKLPTAGGPELHANEPDLKDATLAKVHEPGFEFREGYFNLIVIDPQGRAHIVDGHHRVGLHIEAGHDSLPAKVIDLRTDTPAARALRDKAFPPYPPPTSPKRPLDPQSTLGAVDPRYFDFVNNGGGTLEDPVHVHTGTDGVSLTVRQSDVEKHYRDVITRALNGEPSNSKVDPASLNGAENWYRDAHQVAQDLVDHFQNEVRDENGQPYPAAKDLTVERVAGALSALSPRNGWEKNKESARRAIEGHLKDPTHDLSDRAWLLSMDAHKESFTRDAIRALRGDYGGLTGTKRKSFFNNIVDPDGWFDATMDGWQAAALYRMGLRQSDGRLVDEAKGLAWLGHPMTVQKQEVVEDAGYIILADAMRKVAKQLKMRPSEAQAVYWTAVGGNAKGTSMWEKKQRMEREVAEGVRVPGDES